MVKEHTSLDKEMRWRRIRPYDAEWENKYMYNTYQYRLIESSLKDESELEDFLLQNIKVDD